MAFQKIFLNFLFISNSLLVRHLSTFYFYHHQFPRLSNDQNFFFSCHPNIFTLQMKVWAWKRQEKKNCHPSLSRIFAQKIFVLKIDSLNFLRHEQMRYLEFLGIFTVFKAEGSQRNYSLFYFHESSSKPFYWPL